MEQELKKVLVTGANGFIGKALCAALVKLGYDVCGAVRHERAVKNITQGVVSVVTGDISEGVAWQDILRGVDIVIHLAARVHVMRESAESLDSFRKVNVFGAECLARMAAKAGV